MFWILSFWTGNFGWTYVDFHSLGERWLLLLPDHCPKPRFNMLSTWELWTFRPKCLCCWGLSFASWDTEQCLLSPPTRCQLHTCLVTSENTSRNCQSPCGRRGGKTAPGGKQDIKTCLVLKFLLFLFLKMVFCYLAFLCSFSDMKAVIPSNWNVSFYFIFEWRNTCSVLHMMFWNLCSMSISMELKCRCDRQQMN